MYAFCIELGLQVSNHSLKGTGPMLRNYLIVAYRNLMRYKVYSLINVAGLSIGIAFCILAFLYVRLEWTYDAFHENAARIYRANLVDRTGASSQTPDPFGPALEEAFPDVRTVRIGWGASSVKYQDRSIRGVFRFADPAILEVFTFPLVRGDPEIVFKDPYSLVVTEAASRRYFGDEDPLGKVLSVKIWGQSPVVRDFVITGIAKSTPKNSSIRFDFLAPFSARGEPRGWSMRSIQTFVLLSERERPAEVEDRFSKSLKEMRGDRWDDVLSLQPLLEMHLNLGKRGPEGAGNPAFSYILSGIALFVLAIACVNFITLAVGRSLSRDREVAMRKVTGASRIQLMVQFLGESMVLCAIALLAGLGLAELLLPAFSSFVARDLVLTNQTDGVGVAFLFGLAVAVGMATGGYPAFVLSGIQPAAALKGRLRLGSSNRFGRALVVLQFTLSVFLVVSALLMVRQLEYLKTKPLGFNSENILRIDTWDLLQKDSGRVDLYRNELMRHHAVLGITTSTHAISNRTKYSGTVEYKGEELDVEQVNVGYDFLRTMGIPLVAGSDFDPQSTNPTASIILNETLLRHLGLETPVVGRTLRVNNSEVSVVGVVKDFHVRSLHHRIRPAVLGFDEVGWGRLFVRIRPDNTASTLAFLEEKWREIEPILAFRYSFLDNEVDRQYRREEGWNRVLQLSALFAVFIACLGAFGLTALAVARRTREIGIRKVLGARGSGIVALLTRDFVKLVVIASLIAFPVGILCNRAMAAGFRVSYRPGYSHLCVGRGVGAAGRAADRERPGHPGGVGESGGCVADGVKLASVGIFDTVQFRTSVYQNRTLVCRSFERIGDKQLKII